MMLQSPWKFCTVLTGAFRVSGEDSPGLFNVHEMVVRTMYDGCNKNGL